MLSGSNEDEREMEPIDKLCDAPPPPELDSILQHPDGWTKSPPLSYSALSLEKKKSFFEPDAASCRRERLSLIFQSIFLPAPVVVVVVMFYLEI